MAPQVGLEPYRELPTAESIVRNFAIKTTKTNVYAALNVPFYVPHKSHKITQTADLRYKCSTFLSWIFGSEQLG